MKPGANVISRFGLEPEFLTKKEKKFEIFIPAF